MFSSLRWFWHPFGIVECCTLNFSFGGLAKLGGIIAAPFTGGASLAITAASIQADTASRAAEDARKANEEAAAAAERIAAQNRAAAEASAKAAADRLAMQSATTLPLTQAFSSSPMTRGNLTADNSIFSSPWLILGVGAALLFFIVRK